MAEIPYPYGVSWILTILILSKHQKPSIKVYFKFYFQSIIKCIITCPDILETTNPLMTQLLCEFAVCMVIICAPVYGPKTDEKKKTN